MITSDTHSHLHLFIILKHISTRNYIRTLKSSNPHLGMTRHSPWPRPQRPLAATTCSSNCRPSSTTTPWMAASRNKAWVDRKAISWCLRPCRQRCSPRTTVRRAKARQICPMAIARLPRGTAHQASTIVSRHFGFGFRWVLGLGLGSN